MIRCHPSIDSSSFKRDIEIAIRDAGLSGYVSRDTLREFFNLFSWVYIEGDTRGAFKGGTQLEKFLARFDLFRFKGDSLCYSAVLFYQKLGKVLDLRLLETDTVASVPEGGNKMFSSEDFSYGDLYEMYAKNGGDLSPDFLMFNELFKKVPEKEIKKISSYAEITKVTEITSLVRPDLAYRLATNRLDVGFNKDHENKEERKIYVLQDSTYSMKEYLGSLKMIKAFILNEAFRHDYEVEWLFISNRINHRTSYNKDNIPGKDVQFRFAGTYVDTSTILVRDEFVGKKVVIITDGTDMFNFPFNTKTRSINVISFLDNINVKNKISNYGRFFKVTL